MLRNETASFWRREGADPAKIGTEVFFLPAQPCSKKTARWSTPIACCSAHDKAVEPAGEAKSDPGISPGSRTPQGALRGFDRSEGSSDPRPDLGLRARRRARARTRRTVGAQSAARDQRLLQPPTGEQVAAFADLKDDGSTACGGWIYTGVCPDKETNRARNRDASGPYTAPTGASRGRRTGACSTTARRPIPTASRGANARSTCGGTREAKKWAGRRRAGLSAAKAPDTPANPGATGIDLHSGSDPFIMQLDGAHRSSCRRYAQRRSVPGALRAAGVGRARTSSTNSRAIRRCAMRSRRQPLQQAGRRRLSATCSRRTA